MKDVLYTTGEVNTIKVIYIFYALDRVILTLVSTLQDRWSKDCNNKKNVMNIYRRCRESAVWTWDNYRDSLYILGMISISTYFEFGWHVLALEV